MTITYVFYYKEKKDKEQIICRYLGEEGEKKEFLIGNTDKLIRYITYGITKYCEVYFVNFTDEKIKKIINNLKDFVELEYSFIGNNGPHYIYPNNKAKSRGKNNGMD